MIRLFEREALWGLSLFFLLTQNIPRRYRGTPLKRIKEVQWTYVAGAVIVDTVVYLWSRAAHPLFRGVARRAGVCS